jgi:dTMP kinase
MKEGKLVVVCGIDGAGKTTLLNGLENEFISKSKKVWRTKQPTDFYRNHPHVREYLDTGNAKISLETIALIAATDRMIHIESEILPKLKSGFVVLCDRYVYSTYAYFKARGANLNFVKEINRFVLEPDAVILLNIPSDLAISRVLARDGAARKFEEKNSLYLENVQEYLEQVMPNNCIKINSGLDRNKVLTDAVSYLNSVGIL